jgi:hypothetical protein
MRSQVLAGPWYAGISASAVLDEYFNNAVQGRARLAF